MAVTIYYKFERLSSPNLRDLQRSTLLPIFSRHSAKTGISRGRWKLPVHLKESIFVVEETELRGYEEESNDDHECFRGNSENLIVHELEGASNVDVVNLNVLLR